jgi:THO complex subunit 2
MVQVRRGRLVRFTLVPPHSSFHFCRPYSVLTVVNELTLRPRSFSRKYLIQLHSTPTDSNAADALVTAYHTLLSAALSLWPPEHPLPPSSFSAFVKSMLQALPSSHDAPSPAATALGELLIDTMWSIDLQLDEVIADSKVTIAAQSEREKEQEKEQVNGRPDESNAVLSRDAATKDKSTLQELVRLLLVRRWL